jgi:hypothetical protein
MMLQITPASSVRPPQRPPHSFISAQSIAKASRSKSERAFLAARWIAGSLSIQKPTAILAGLVFGVSPTATKSALKIFNFKTASAIEAAWGETLYLEREAFIRDHANEILALLDRIITPTAA